LTLTGKKTEIKSISEEITIPIAAAAGVEVQSTTNLLPANSIIQCVVGRVTQSCTGATSFDACVNADGNGSLGDDIAVTLATTFNQIADGDGNRNNVFLTYSY